jgi:hypothetical protein
VWVQRETVLKVPLTGIVSATEMDSTTTMKTLRELTPGSHQHQSPEAVASNRLCKDTYRNYTPNRRNPTEAADTRPHSGGS